MNAMTYTPARTWRTVGRGLAAVARLLLTALDALITAAVGIPPVGWIARQVGVVIRETYRLGRFGPPSPSREVAVVIEEGEIVNE